MVVDNHKQRMYDETNFPKMWCDSVITGWSDPGESPKVANALIAIEILNLNYFHISYYVEEY